MTPRVRTALWVTPVADLAGVARHVLDVVGTGVAGWRIVVMTPPGPLADALATRGAAVVVDAFGPSAGLGRSMRSLRDVVARLRPEVVHSHLSYADIVATSAGLFSRRGPKLLSTEHGIAADDRVYHGTVAKARVMAQVHRRRLARLDGLITVSEATRRAVAEKWGLPGALPVAVIPNGIDRGLGVPTRRPGMHVGSVCRLAPEKRLDDLIDAFAEVVATRPTARLTIAGEGSLAGALRDRVDRLGLTTVVDFPGYVDAEALLEEVDVVAQLSVWENCSYALLDALRAGCGVVATDVGGNAEVVGRAGLVPLGDVGAVAKQIIEQGDHLGRRPSIGTEWPSVADMCGRIADFYGEVVR